jgi:hypothetical protein
MKTFRTLVSSAVVAAIVVAGVPASASAQQPGDPPDLRQTAVKGDPLWNGALIGAGVGVAAAWVFLRKNCGPAGYDSECAAIAGPVGFVTFVPIGAVAGALVDKAIGRHSIAVSPSRGGGRVTWSLRF